MFITSRDRYNMIISCYDDYHLLRAYLEPVMGMGGGAFGLDTTSSRAVEPEFEVTPE